MPDSNVDYVRYSLGIGTTTGIINETIGSTALELTHQIRSRSRGYQIISSLG